ncbi:hypothetical protein [Azospirillum palustre]
MLHVVLAAGCVSQSYIGFCAWFLLLPSLWRNIDMKKLD